VSARQNLRRLEGWPGTYAHVATSANSPRIVFTYPEVFGLYLKCPQERCERLLQSGHFRYSDLKEAAPVGPMQFEWGRWLLAVERMPCSRFLFALSRREIRCVVPRQGG
jgi:hypothetical protein